MRLLAKPLAILMCLLALVTPCMADIIPNEAPARVKDAQSSDVVKAKLATIGVAPSESATIVARLSNEELQFLAQHDKANVAVGQDDLVVMFWYEWIFAALCIGMGVWAWQEWGEDAFFKD